MSPTAVITGAPAVARWDEALRRWPDAATREWADQLIAAAQESAAVLAVVATGSAVRDVEHSDDLDLVVIYRGPLPALPRPPISVDMRTYNSDDVPALVTAGHSYLTWAVRFGRVVLERENWWSQLRERCRDRLQLPSADESIKLAQRFEQQRDGLAANGDADAAADLELAALTHRARAALIQAGVFPQSRPELAGQLREIGEVAVADRLDDAVRRRRVASALG